MNGQQPERFQEGVPCHLFDECTIHTKFWKIIMVTTPSHHQLSYVIQAAKKAISSGFFLRHAMKSSLLTSPSLSMSSIWNRCSSCKEKKISNHKMDKKRWRWNERRLAPAKALTSFMHVDINAVLARNLCWYSYVGSQIRLTHVWACTGQN